tara:strand:- start:2178 stop:9356 length:7179 start_codon:yes stop_codon:yes gene_type:complete
MSEDLKATNIETLRLITDNSISINASATIDKTLYSNNANIKECNVHGGLSSENELSVGGYITFNSGANIADIKKNTIIDYNVEKTSSIRSSIKTSEKSITFISGITASQIILFNEHSFNIGDTIVIQDHEITSFNKIHTVLGPLTPTSFYVEVETPSILIGKNGTCNPSTLTSLCTITTTSDHPYKQGDTITLNNHSNSEINGIPYVIQTITAKTLSLLVNSTYTGGIGGTIRYTEYAHLFINNNFGSLSFQNDNETYEYNLSNDKKKYEIKGNKIEYVKNIEQFGENITATFQTELGNKVIAVNKVSHGLLDKALVKISSSQIQASDTTLHGLNVSIFQSIDPYEIDMTFNSFLNFFNTKASFSLDIQNVISFRLDTDDSSSEIYSNNLGKIKSTAHGLTTGDFIQIKPNTIQMLLGIPQGTEPETYTEIQFPSETLNNSTLFRVVVLTIDYFYITTSGGLQYKIVSSTVTAGRYLNYDTITSTINSLQRDYFLIDFTNYLPGNVNANETVLSVPINYEILLGNVKLTTYETHFIKNNDYIRLSGINSTQNILDSNLWLANNVTDTTVDIISSSRITTISNDKGYIQTENKTSILDESTNHVYVINTLEHEFSCNISNERLINFNKLPFSKEIKFHTNSGNVKNLVYYCDSSYGETLYFQNNKVFNNTNSPIVLNQTDKTNYTVTYNINKDISKDENVYNKFNISSGGDTIVLSNPYSNFYKYNHITSRGNNYYTLNNYFEISSLITSVTEYTSNLKLNLITGSKNYINTTDVISLYDINNVLLGTGNVSSNISDSTNITIYIGNQNINSSSIYYYKQNGEYIYTNKDNAYITNSSNIQTIQTQFNIPYNYDSSTELFNKESNISSKQLYDISSRQYDTLIRDITMGPQTTKLNESCFINTINLPIKNTLVNKIPEFMKIEIEYNNKTYTTDKRYIEYTGSSSANISFTLNDTLFVNKNDRFTIKPVSSSSNISIYQKDRNLSTLDTDNELVVRYETLKHNITGTKYEYLENYPYTSDSQVLKLNLSAFTTSNIKTMNTSNIIKNNGNVILSSVIDNEDLYLHETSISTSSQADLILFDSSGNTFRENVSNKYITLEQENSNSFTHSTISIVKKKINIQSVYITSTLVGDVLTNQIVFTSDNHGLFMNDKVSVYEIFLSYSDGTTYDFTNQTITGDSTVSAIILDDNEFRINLPTTININSLLEQLNPYVELENRYNIYAGNEKIRVKNTRSLENQGPSGIQDILSTDTTEHVCKIDNLVIDSTNLITLSLPNLNGGIDSLTTRDDILLNNVFLYRSINSGDSLISVSYQSLVVTGNIISFYINDSTFNNETSSVSVNSSSNIYGSSGNEASRGTITSWVENTVITSFPSGTNMNTVTSYYPRNGGTLKYQNITRVVKDSTTSNISTFMNVYTKTNTVAQCYFQHPNLDSIDPSVKNMTGSANTYIDKKIKDDTFLLELSPTTDTENIYVNRNEFSFNGNINRQLVYSIETSTNNYISSNLGINSNSYTLANNTWQTIQFSNRNKTFYSIGLKIQNKTSLTRGSIYIQLYKESTTDGTFNTPIVTNMYADEIKDETEYTYFYGDMIEINGDDIYTYKIIDNTVNGDKYSNTYIQYITNITGTKTSDGHDYILSSYTNGVINTDVQYINFTNSMYTLPNVSSINNTTSGSVNIWDTNFINSGPFVTLKNVLYTDTLNGSSVDINITGNIVCSGLPSYDEKLGTVNLYKYETVWTIQEQIYNPDRYEILKDSVMSANINGTDVVMNNILNLPLASELTRTANIISENIKELEIILCDNSTSLTSNVLLEQPVDNSIITFNNTIGDSNYNTFVQNSTLRINNILNNSFTVSNLHIPFTETNGNIHNISQYDSLSRGNITYVSSTTNSNITSDVYYNTIDHTLTTFNNGVVHNFSENDRIYVFNMSDIVSEHVYDVSKTTFENNKQFSLNIDYNSSLLSSNINYINLSAEPFNSYFSWGNIELGYILKRDTNKAWTINGEYTYQTNAEYYGEVPPAGKYTTNSNTTSKYSKIQNTINAEFGKSVAISGDGDIISIGAPSYDNGRVYVYKNENFIKLYKKYKSSEYGGVSNFGMDTKISPDGKTIIIQDSVKIHIFYDFVFVSSITPVSGNTNNITTFLNNNKLIISNSTTQNVYIYNLFMGENKLEHTLTEQIINVPFTSTTHVSSNPRVSINTRTPNIGTPGTKYEVYNSPNVAGINDSAYKLSLKSITADSFSISFDLANVSSNTHIEYTSNVCLSNYEFHNIEAWYVDGYVNFYVDNEYIGKKTGVLPSYNTYITGDAVSVYPSNEYVFGTANIKDTYNTTSFGKKAIMNNNDNVMYVSSENYVHAFYYSYNKKKWLYSNLLDTKTNEIVLNEKTNMLYNNVTNISGFNRYG